MIKIVTKNTGQTARVARKVSSILKKGDIVLFRGELGSGKTFMIKNIAVSFKVNPKEVKSSSFIIMREYPGTIPVVHIDLYRLTPAQIPDEVFTEMSEKKGLVLIEWADKINFPGGHFRIDIKYLSLTSREISLTASSKELEMRLRKLGKEL